MAYMRQLIWRAHRLDQLIGLIPANRLIRDHLRDLSLRSRIGRYKVVYQPQLFLNGPLSQRIRPSTDPLDDANETVNTEANPKKKLEQDAEVRRSRWPE